MPPGYLNELLDYFCCYRHPVRWTMTGSDLPEKVWKNWGRESEMHSADGITAPQLVDVHSLNKLQNSSSETVSKVYMLRIDQYNYGFQCSQ